MPTNLISTLPAGDSMGWTGRAQLTSPSDGAVSITNNAGNAGASLTLGSLTLGTPLSAANGGTGLSSLGSGVATFLGTPSSANLAAAVTDETGSGALVFGTSPTLGGTISIDPTATTGGTITTPANSLAINGVRQVVLTPGSGWNTIAEGAALSLGLGTAFIFGLSDGHAPRFERTENGANGKLLLRRSTGTNSFPGFDIANTHTSTTNGEWLRAGWASNVARIGTVKGSGGGTARAMALMTDDTNVMEFGSTPGQVSLIGLPTSDPGVANRLWIDTGADNVLKVSTG